MKWFIAVFKKYAVFTGRARRSEYWYFTLFFILVFVALIFVDVFTGMYDVESGRGLTSTIFTVVSIVPSIAVGVRRMHDINKSGWYLLIPIYSLILCCTDGDKGPNEYGPDPKNEEASSSSSVLDANI
jgi:uncharacterized membrane protein YhaH (DUF805 family)